jgi:cardiolipin synthase
MRGSSRASALILVGTSVRIVATPVVMGLVLSHSWTAAAVVFLVAASTDWFDGRLARRWNVSSRLGSFLDTTADKLLITGALVALVAVTRASPWVSMVIIGRELSLLGLPRWPLRDFTSNRRCSASRRRRCSSPPSHW